tara:strand:+ start:745 stop:1197 length:453 start_codon:yes stop_codon:yes gene_type:complete
MPEKSLLNVITEAMRAAMRAKQKERLGAIRLVLAEIKKVEVDERIVPDDARVISILDKMVKQRKDSFKQFADAGRDELAAKEQGEIEVIQEFLPNPLSEEEITSLIDDAVSSTGAASMQDMGKLMSLLKPQMTGRADMGKVSGLIKQRLS